MRSLRALPGLPLLILAAACSSDDGDEKTTPKLDTFVHHTVADEQLKVVAGVEICVVGHAEIPCVTTDDLGIANLAVPKNQELVLSYEKTDFVTKRRNIFTDPSHETGLGTWLFQRKVWYDELAIQLGGSIDYSLGMFGLQTDPIAGVAFVIEPKPASIKGPIQFATVQGKLGLCPPSGTTCDLGVTSFVDVPPGKYRATFEAPGKTCTPAAFACADGAPGCVEIEVVAGANSFANVPCK